MYRIIAIMIIIDILIYYVETSAYKLKFVQIVFRHGIRAPVVTFPSSPYGSDYWEQYGGLGELTPHGMNLMHDFGVYLKQNYSSFLSEHYHPSKLKVRSTNSPRALQSAAALLGGLYQPTEKQKWKINWLPIPIMNSEFDRDTVFFDSDCPKYHKKKREAHDSEESQAVLSRNKPLLRKLSNLSQIDSYGYHLTWIVADNYLVAEAMNLKVPEWVLEHKEKLLEIHDYNFYFDMYTKEMAKLISGAILNDMIKNIKHIVNQDRQWQMYLYSCHDYFINGLLKLLNLHPIKQPNFAAALFFELYQSTANDDYFVKVYYKNNSVGQNITRTLLKIEGCEELCPLKKFYELTADKIIENPPEHCE